MKQWTWFLSCALLFQSGCHCCWHRAHHRQENVEVVAQVQVAAPATVQAPVTFMAMGCGPYDDSAAVAVGKFIRLENQRPSVDFIVHLGDIVTGKRKDWPESQYIKIASLLHTGNRLPTFIVPGDNEWNDMADPASAWDKWSAHFMQFDRQWPFPVPVARQDVLPENFAFVLNGVLFIGINKVGGTIHDKAEWQRRLANDAVWIAAQFEAHVNEVRAAVIFAQADAQTKTIADSFLVEPFAAAAKKFNKPVLYLHADGHVWFEKPGHWAPNILHVQQDLVNAKFPPVHWTVTTDPDKPFVYERHLNDPRWVDKDKADQVKDVDG